jgi:hypothetical protein
VQLRHHLILFMKQNHSNSILFDSEQQWSIKPWQ